MCLPLSYTFTTPVVPKSFRYAWSRRNGLPPSDEGAEVGSGYGPMWASAPTVKNAVRTRM